MKALLVCIVLLGGFGVALARDITTTTRQTYKNVSVTQVEATGIRISHEDGVALVEFSILPEAIQREFGYNPAAAAALKAQQESTAISYRDQVAAARAQQAAEAASQAAQARRFNATLTALSTPRTVSPLPAPSIAERDYSATDYSARSYGGDRYTSRSYGGGTIHVSGYTRKDGTYVRPHTRRAPR